MTDGVVNGFGLHENRKFMTENGRTEARTTCF